MVAEQAGFVRSPEGTITTFDVLGLHATRPTGINARGEVTGWYSDANGMNHGFIRAPDGAIATFDAAPEGTIPLSINTRGEITGYCYRGGKIFGFVRSPHGVFFTFAASPGAGATVAVGINTEGDIAGYVGDSSGTHGFLRDAHPRLWRPDEYRDWREGLGDDPE